MKSQCYHLDLLMLKEPPNILIHLNDFQALEDDLLQQSIPNSVSSIIMKASIILHTEEHKMSGLFTTPPPAKKHKYM